MIGLNRLTDMGIGAFIGVIVTVLVMTLSRQTQPRPIVIEALPERPTAVPTATPSPIRVFVSGAVGEPAVYALPPDGIVQDAVLAAGGFAAEANTAVVNLAQPLQDGMQVYIPTVEELEETAVSLPGVIVAPHSLVDTGTGGANDGRVDINEGTIEQLDTLPGIGPATAQKIIEFRENNGPFLTVEEIMLVSGIGPATFERLESLITVGNP